MTPNRSRLNMTNTNITMNLTRNLKSIAVIGVLLLTATLPMTLTGCSTGKTSDKQLQFVSADQAMEMVGTRKKALGLGGKATGVFVDARSEADFKAGHIPGAISMPYERLDDEHDMLKAYDPVIVYGKEYNDPRALGMSKRLIELKYGNIHTLTGGINEWKDAGNELATEEAGG